MTTIKEANKIIKASETFDLAWLNRLESDKNKKIRNRKASKLATKARRKK